MKNKNIVVC